MLDESTKTVLKAALATMRSVTIDFNANGPTVREYHQALFVTELCVSKLEELGGLRVVANCTDRNLISALERKVEMVVMCQDTLVAWQLVGGITNADWVQFESVSGKTSKEICVRAVRLSMGDDLERAKAAFRGMTQEEMALPYSGSGSTRQQILDGYQLARDEKLAALAWLEAR